MTPTFFAQQSDFRKWLQKNHRKEKELLVGFYKTSCEKPSMTWPQSVDEALCFGWIDGRRNSIDADSYTIRFTPRKPTSIWSAINIKKVKELIEKKLMQPAGLELFENRDPSNTNKYSFESKEKKFPAAFKKQFKENKTAWKFFAAQPPSYKKFVTHWVMTAKKEATQHNRLHQLIRASQQQQRVLWL